MNKINNYYQVIDAWMEAAKGKDFTVFDHIGSECLYDTIALAKHAVVYKSY